MEDENSCAAEAAIALARTRTADGVPAIHRVDDTPVRLLPAVTDPVIDLLDGVAAGKTVTVAPAGAMLTTGQAANFLNASRPHLAKLLGDGEIPFTPVGPDGRFVNDDLTTCKDWRGAVRNAELDERARLGQEFDAS